MLYVARFIFFFTTLTTTWKKPRYQSTRKLLEGPVSLKHRQWRPSNEDFLKSTNHRILHYLWSTDLSNSFSQLICVNIYFSQSKVLTNIIVSQYFFNRFKSMWKNNNNFLTNPSFLLKFFDDAFQACLCLWSNHV